MPSHDIGAHNLYQSTTVHTMRLFDLLYFYCHQSHCSQHSLLQPYNRQMAGYCIYEMYLFSRISKALFEQVFSGTDTDKDADTHRNTHTHTLSSQSLILSRKSSCKV